MDTVPLDLSGDVPTVTVPAQDLLDLLKVVNEITSIAIDTPTPPVEYFDVESYTDPGKFYTVTLIDNLNVACTCPAWIYDNQLGTNPCKHMRNHAKRSADRRIKDLEGQLSPTTMRL